MRVAPRKNIPVGQAKASLDLLDSFARALQTRLEKPYKAEEHSRFVHENKAPVGEAIVAAGLSTVVPFTYGFEEMTADGVENVLRDGPMYELVSKAFLRRVQEAIGVYKRIIRDAPSTPAPSSAIGAMLEQYRATQGSGAGIKPPPGAAPKPKTPPSTVDLTWMYDDELRKIAESDRAELAVCQPHGAHKASMLLAGSLCEAMLLDVFQRNEPLTRNLLGKSGGQFPERTNVDELIELAIRQGFITSTVKEYANAMKVHRDLIHPNRVRVEKPMIGERLTGMVVSTAYMIGDELRAACADGRVAVFEVSELGS